MPNGVFTMFKIIDEGISFILKCTKPIPRTETAGIRSSEQNACDFHWIEVHYFTISILNVDGLGSIQQSKKMLHSSWNGVRTMSRPSLCFESFTVSFFQLAKNFARRTKMWRMVCWLCRQVRSPHSQANTIYLYQKQQIKQLEKAKPSSQTTTGQEMSTRTDKASTATNTKIYPGCCS